MNYEIILATNNKHKLQEAREILSPCGIVVYGLSDLQLHPEEVDENGKDYYENALLKANSVKPLTILPVIADDSGLEVIALDNKPGLHSARYASECGGHDKAMENIIKDLEGKDRSARFICDIVAINLDDRPLKFEGICEGEIIDHKDGTSGFGYDPIFKCKATGKTFASMDSKEKNLYSHRALALKKLVTYLRVTGKISCHNLPKHEHR